MLSLGNNAFGQCGRPFVENEEYFPNFKVHRIEGIDEKIKDVSLVQNANPTLKLVRQLIGKMNS